MYLNPFVAGVLCTLFAELVVFFCAGMFSVYKAKKK